MSGQPENLYVHFPFCRRKCTYCALYSRTGAAQGERDAYVRRLAREIGAECRVSRASLKTVYFGGGSPALCDLGVLAPVLRPLCGAETEFTVELHPQDVTEAKLDELKRLGVNRVSMGVQSLDDATLAAMGRGYTVAEAERAFAGVKRRFDNAGIDLIVGYPGDAVAAADGGWNWRQLKNWGLRHCSVYTLQNDRGLRGVPDDDAVLDIFSSIIIHWKMLGLERYEISNFAVPGFECRHNLAVWRGEDYLGIGEGACGRIGLRRTKGLKAGLSEFAVSPDEDLKERTIFRLRTREGLDASAFSSLPTFAELVALLDGQVRAGLLTRDGLTYRLTPRGAEVCDSILAELV